MLRHLTVLLLALTAPLLPAAPPDFNRDIRPILSENCYHCHGPDAAKREADLRLDDEKAAKSSAIIPGKSADSELIKRIFATDPDDVMPTPKSNRHLTEAQKNLLKQWVDAGAPWSRHWSFEKVDRPKVPTVPSASSKNPIDAFILARLAQEKLSPSPRADLPTLVRRIALDLTGLPPTPEQVATVTAAEQKLPDSGLTAFIDQCLNSTRYGERWCWDWLRDAARYADTNGYQGDPERTMWPWRDWVTKAVNANMPYDQFTVWQIAGDLMPKATPEQKLASGFNRNHMINGEGGRIAEETRVENVFDRVETTSTVWLGLTVGCCRCHDHKFDPLSQKDYFAMYDFFNQTSEDGKGRSGQAAPAMDISTPAEQQRLKDATAQVARVAADVEAFELKKFPRPAGKPLTESAAVNLPGNLPQAYIAKTEPKNRSADALLEAVSYFKDKDPEYNKQLQRLLNSVRARTTAANNITRVMVMDTLPTPRETFVLDKGAYDKPTATKVTANVPASLPALKTQGAAANRLDLAQWLVSRDNPLTARVTVNRFWQAFFGIGLVKTAEDFGVQGENPVHRELLDWLAAEFMDSGWDVKALHRLIVTSAAYQQSSRLPPGLHERDPDNRLLARGPRFRLPSWMIRDQALFLAGLLKEQPSGPPVKPYQPEGIWEEATFGKKTYQQDHGDALYRRTLYSFWRRIVGPTSLFDNAARQVCAIKTVRTNTPLHALVTLNDITYAEAARAMSAKILLGRPTTEIVRIVKAFQTVTLRDPTTSEINVLNARLEDFRAHYTANPAAAADLLSTGESKRDETLPPASDHAAWTSLCLLLFNLDEVLTKE